MSKTLQVQAVLSLKMPRTTIQRPTRLYARRNSHAMTYDVPILLVTWRRSDTTTKLIDRLRKLRPSRLFIASDGARSDREQEQIDVATTRQVIETIIDWPCTIQKRFSPINQGCKAGVSNAISWFFENVDEGIILEDDILPDESFFPYCEEMLQKYRHDQRIGSITACNFQPENSSGMESYYFSRYVHVWGWATWKRAWSHYDGTMQHWPELRDSGWLKQLKSSQRFSKFWGRKFNAVYSGQKDTWDYAWVYSSWKQGFLSCTPKSVLASNIGFGNYATHTMNQISPLGEIKSITFPLIHPESVEIDSIADWWTQNIHYAKPKSETRQSIYLFIYKAMRWLKAIKKKFKA